MTGSVDQSRGMLDTSTVILLGHLANPDELPNEFVISAITLAELSVAPHVARTDAERSARQQHLQQAEADFEVLPFDAESARAFGVSLPCCVLRAANRPRGPMTHSLRPAPSHTVCRCTRATQLTFTGYLSWTYVRLLTQTTRGWMPSQVSLLIKSVVGRSRDGSATVALSSRVEDCPAT